MISAVASSTTNVGGGDLPAAPGPIKPAQHLSPTLDFIDKVGRIGARSAVVYPFAAISAQVKGGGTYGDGFSHGFDKLRRFHKLHTGSGAYLLAGSASMVPAAMADPVKNALIAQGVEAGMAQKLALGASALATGITTNFRNFAFTDGKHGLDAKKIFHTVPVASSLIRDTATGLVYANALQNRPNETRFEKVRQAGIVGFPAGVFTSGFDVLAYMAAKEKIDLKALLMRTVRTAPLRGFNVALGAMIMAALAPAGHAQSKGPKSAIVPDVAGIAPHSAPVHAVPPPVIRP